MNKTRTNDEIRKMAAFCRMREVAGAVVAIGPADCGLIADALEELQRRRGVEPSAQQDETKSTGEILNGPMLKIFGDNNEPTGK